MAPEVNERDHVANYQWETWTPGMKATLVFIKEQDSVLLIHKKTGLGKGKVNGPGGKREANESWSECARRELMEELKIEAGQLTWVAELNFLMSDCPDILCHVFTSTQYLGEPRETEEAKPFWVKQSQIPFDQMWPDDRYWLPQALNGERVHGKFSFDGEKLLSFEVSAHRCTHLEALPIN